MRDDVLLAVLHSSILSLTRGTQCFLYRPLLCIVLVTILFPKVCVNCVLGFVCLSCVLVHTLLHLIVLYLRSPAIF